MITYAYWIIVFILIFGCVWLFGGKLNSWRGAFISGLLVLGVAWAAYFFYFQQVFVKRWGGVMNISVPDGQRHITATWKDDNLWIENFDPKTNRCIFTEYSKGNVLEGKVIIKKCNPLGVDAAAPTSPPPQITQ
jgi:hypothetical protein